MIVSNKIVFSNENIYCTPISSEHISLGWLDWINDQETTKHLATNSSITTSKVDLEKYLKETKSIFFLACYTKEGVYFGNLRIYRIGKNSISFGRLIGLKELRGKGLGTKLASLALRICFEKTDTKFVIVGNSLENKASAESKLKSGFSLATNSFLSQEQIALDPSVEFYYITREQFQNKI